MAPSSAFLRPGHFFHYKREVVAVMVFREENRYKLDQGLDLGFQDWLIDFLRVLGTGLGFGFFLPFLFIPRPLIF